MILYPAIDIRGGQCVRLTQGRYDDMTVFAPDPISVALKFQEAGARWLHVVDLDGARNEAGNRELIARIARTLSIPVQTGGGIRTFADIQAVLEAGISRVILGTAAVRDPELVKKAVEAYGEKIAVGIDAKDGYVAIEGWEKTSSFRAVEFARTMEAMGVKTIIYTDIATDGMLSGPNLAAMKEMSEAVSLNIIASGGVSKVADLLSLKALGLHGAIVGKALYTGAIDLKQALTALGG
jgi:phosphoribosylformimino-5-aminoimidazole carboxamide ribotide isomerase